VAVRIAVCELGCYFCIDVRWIVLVMLLGGCAPAVTYERSPQWHGGHFANLASWPTRTGERDFLKWQLGGRPPAPRGFRAPFVENDGAALRENRTATSITWIGHATMLLQAGGVTVLTDPIFSDAISGLIRRYAPPGVALQSLPRVDVVVLSHNHRDHLDENSVLALGPEVQYVVPLGMAAWFRDRGLVRVTELDWWQSTAVETADGTRATITMVPAQHWSQRSIADRNLSLWGGYIIDAGGRRFYFAGDSGFPAAFDEIGRRFPGIEFAMLPIGAYEPRWFLHPQHMSPEEAAEAFRRLGAHALVPIHWATFHLSDEPPEEPPKLLYRALGAQANRILFLPIGGTYWAPPDATARR
jgi:L-ascorbate metabolism protein UlaG (beta-lactamase superfamily)